MAFVVWINLFPEGYILVGGDVLQEINLSEQFSHVHDEWFGRVSLFYLPFYVLDKIGVSWTAQLSWYLGIFLFSAYFSFLAFEGLMFPSIFRRTRVLAALFYATNIYTLYIFTSSWGYTHYQIIYIFIPVLTGLYIKALRENGWRFSLLFLALAIVASMSFSNPAFALALGIYFFLLTVVAMFLGIIGSERKIWKRVTVLVIGAFLLNAYWILPLVPQISIGVESVANSSDIVLTDVLRKKSNAIYDTVRLVQTGEWKYYFPQNFPYPQFSWVKKWILALAFSPFLLVLWSWFRGKIQKEQQQLFLLWITLFVIFIMLVAHTRFPFETINDFLFQLPGFNTMRGYDKTATFTPFLLSALFLVALNGLEKEKYFKFVLVGAAAVVLLLALPFYAGGLQTRLSYIMSGQKAKDFKKAKYSVLVKIPESYKDAAKIIDKNPSDEKLSVLPYSPGSSVGRVNLPERKINGPDILRGLSERKYIDLTEARFNDRKFAEDFNGAIYNPRWIVDLYGLLGIKYVAYHWDAKKNVLEKFELARAYLEDNKMLNQIFASKDLTVYTIEEKRIFPYIYSASGELFVSELVGGLAQKIENFRSNMVAVDYSRKSMWKISVPVKQLVQEKNIYLNEMSHPLWTAEYVAPDGKRRALRKINGVVFANVWQISDIVGQDGAVEIYYKPIYWMLVGQVISSASILTLFLFGAYATKKKIL